MSSIVPSTNTNQPVLCHSAIHELDCQSVNNERSIAFKVTIFTRSAYDAMQALDPAQTSLLSAQFYAFPPLYASGAISTTTSALWCQITPEPALIAVVQSLTRPSYVCSAPYDISGCHSVKITLNENPLGAAIATTGSFTHTVFHPFDITEIAEPRSYFDLPAVVPDAELSEVESYSIPESRSISVPHTAVSRSGSSLTSMELSSIGEALEIDELHSNLESPNSSRAPSAVEAA